MYRFLIAFVIVLWLGCGAGYNACAEGITAVAVGNTLLSFDSATPGTTHTSLGITGLQQGEIIRDLDFHPTTGQLFGISTAGRIYSLDPQTGAARLVLSLGDRLLGRPLGFDFNPVDGSLRVTAEANQNFRVNLDTGEITVAGLLNYEEGGNPSADIRVVGLAFSNNVASATTTTLYGINSSQRTLVRLDSPDSGTLTTVGPLIGSGILDSTNIGFDISGVTGTAYAVFFGEIGGAGLFSVNLNTGISTRIGRIGSMMSGQVVGLAVTPSASNLQPVPEPVTILLLGTGLAGVGATVRKQRQANRRTQS